MLYLTTSNSYNVELVRQNVSFVTFGVNLFEMRGSVSIYNIFFSQTVRRDVILLICLFNIKARIKLYFIINYAMILYYA